MSKFKEFWKSHDVGVQDELDNVKEEVHEMDEQLDTIEEESKPGAEKGMEHEAHRLLNDKDYQDREWEKLSEYERQQRPKEMARRNAQKSVDNTTARNEDFETEKASTNGEVDNPHAEENEMVEKPGESIHSAKFDDCVRDVQSKNPKANAYAVCVAQLGDEAFKSEHRHKAYIKSKIKEAKKEMGIGFAGPTPESLLARQDMEAEADESEEAIREGESNI
jgi:hypothetical protein